MESTEERCGYITDERQLLTEIEPILKDFFVADFNVTADGLIMKLGNGQKFKLSITEITQQ